jgi:hypothetical protein
MMPRFAGAHRVPDPAPARVFGYRPNVPSDSVIERRDKRLRMGGEAETSTTGLGGHDVRFTAAPIDRCSTVCGYYRFAHIDGRIGSNTAQADSVRSAPFAVDDLLTRAARHGGRGARG